MFVIKVVNKIMIYQQSTFCFTLINV